MGGAQCLCRLSASAQSLKKKRKLYKNIVKRNAKISGKMRSSYRRREKKRKRRRKQQNGHLKKGSGIEEEGE